MIWRSRDPRYDVASGISQGARDYQEDAITADFPVGAEAGFVVLADGMGGHAAGDVASKIILTEVYSELKFHYADVEAFELRAPEILRSVAEFANDTLREHSDNHPETRGMGATLVVPALVENRLWWISIGDSPLFLYRNGQLSQLNEDHSMGPQIDFMVQSGLLDAKIAVDHPDRNCLLSVLMGSAIAKVDCPTRPLELKAGDIVICASDGLQFLSNAQITKTLAKYRKARSTEIAERLLDELDRLGDPDQDNISFTIIKVNDVSVRPKAAGSPQSTVAVPRPRGLTTVVAEPEVVTLPIPSPEPVPEPTVAVEPEQVAASVILPMAEVVEIESILRETAQAAEAEAASLDDEAPQVIVAPRRFAALA
jgi:PPM family protein phosphatase